MDNIQLMSRNTTDLTFGGDSQSRSSDRFQSPSPGPKTKSPSKEHAKKPIVIEENPIQVIPKQQVQTFGSNPVAFTFSVPPEKIGLKESKGNTYSKTSLTQGLDTSQFSPQNDISTNMSTQIDDQRGFRFKTNQDYSPGSRFSTHTSSQKSLERIVRGKSPNKKGTKKSTSKKQKSSPKARNSSPKARNSSPLTRQYSTTDSFMSLSPSRKQYSGGSTGIYFDNKAARILQSAASNTSLSKRGAASPSPKRSLSTTRFGTSSTRNLHTEPTITTNNPKAKALKEIKLTGKTGEIAHSDAKKGLTIVRVILNDAIDEKAQFKALIKDLKDAMKAEQEFLDQKNENIKLLNNGMHNLDKRSNTLEKNTEGAHKLTIKATEDVSDLQNEVNKLKTELAEMAKQIQIEKDLVAYLTVKTKQLKVQTLEEIKARDSLKADVIEGSRREKNKAVERYQEAFNTQSLFLKTIESQFEKFATEN